MTVLDLRSIRCPLALVTLKVTLKRELLSTPDTKNCSLKLLFSSESAMSDIILYLDKKAYHYQILKHETLFSLIIINANKGNTEC
ncbi:hypothetical protein [Psychromonas sp. Urea-02u-13]|uniref:hypothetical protein n=1 Tax=Psychromonas sp. Urea-02u-13 TaxID=2058326 RepID=UPI000C3338A0|nr:hypothetical protein [Psychromonas sp. Urea-02u-13]PKG39957.1 hypothetical protein CXF74_05175 [Psychromonas sp. Urea-02u-13]